MKRTRTILLACASVALVACASAQPRPSAPEPTSADEVPAAEEPGRPTAFVAKSGRVTLSSFALAGRVSVEGLRAVGGAVGGFVRQGGPGATRSWRTGVEATRAVARAEADSVREAAHGP